MAGIVDVIANLIVAALVNRNDTVVTIDAVSEHAIADWERPIARACSTSRSSTYAALRMPTKPIDP